MAYKTKEEQHDYNQKYYAEHKEKIRAYRAKHKEERSAKNAKYYIEHREERLAYHANYRAEHKEDAANYYSEHKEEINARTRNYYIEHREEKLNSELMKTYNLSIEDYNKILYAQADKCAVCGNPPIGKRLAVDHNHMTGEIRGLLCQKCNLMLGCANDSADVLAKAIKYLKNHDS